MDSTATKRANMLAYLRLGGWSWEDISGAFGYASPQETFRDAREAPEPEVRLDVHARQAAAYEMRLQGHSWKHIAHTLHYTAGSGARKGVLRYLGGSLEALGERSSTRSAIRTRMYDIGRMREQRCTWAHIATVHRYAAPQNAAKSFYRWKRTQEARCSTQTTPA